MNSATDPSKLTTSKSTKTPSKAHKSAASAAFKDTDAKAAESTPEVKTPAMEPPFEQPVITEEPTLEKISQKLKEAREALGQTEEAVAGVLKLPLRFVKAIEQSNLEKLPSRTYARGYILSYAKLVGLDSTQISKELQSIFGASLGMTVEFPAIKINQDSQEPPKSMAVLGPRKNWIKQAVQMVALFVLLAALLYAGYYAYESYSLKDQQQDHQATIIELDGESANSSEETLLQDAFPQLPAVSNNEAQNEAETEASQGLESTEDSANEENLNSEAEASKLPESPAVESTQEQGFEPSQVTNQDQTPPAMPELSSVQESKEATKTANNSPILTIKAAASSWIRVETNAGQVIIEQFVTPRTPLSVELPDNLGNLQLTVGNAPYTEVTFRDQPISLDSSTRKSSGTARIELDMSS